MTEREVPHLFVEGTVVRDGVVRTETCQLFVPPVYDLLKVELAAEKLGDEDMVSLDALIPSFAQEEIRAMAELGIDISQQQSKTLDRYLGEPFDDVITVCDTAAEACPVFPGAARRRHWSFEDPSKATGNEAEQLKVYRRVRDEIRSRIEKELLN